MKWLPAEDALLRANYDEMTRPQLAALLGRTESMVRSRCGTLGLNSKGSRAWTDADIARLISVYAEAKGEPVDLQTLALDFGRSHAGVALKASKLGLGDYCRHKVPGGGKSHLPRFATDAELRAHRSAITKAWQAERGHPRGMLGKKHTPETLATMSAAGKRAWSDPLSRHNSPEASQRRSDNMVARIAAGQMRNGYNRSAGGRRSDLDDRYFRSSWEANYARYLNLLVSRREISSWEYEPRTFVFEKIRRGTRAYTPDFRVSFANGRHEWHEVKGWMDPKSKTRLARMTKYYPDEKVIVVGEGWFRQAVRGGLAALLPGWERGKNRGARGC